MKKSKFRVKSISYVHDPDAVSLWTSDFIEVMKEEILESVSKQNEPVHINGKKE